MAARLDVGWVKTNPAHLHLCRHACTLTHARMLMHLRAQAPTHTQTRTLTHTTLAHPRARIHARTHTHVRMHTQARTRACVFFLSIAFPGRAPTNGSRRVFLCLFYCCFCCCHVRDVSGGDVITVLACFVAVALGTHVSLVVMSRANAGSWASDSASLKSLRAWAGSVYVYSLGLCLSVIVRNM